MLLQLLQMLTVLKKFFRSSLPQIPVVILKLVYPSSLYKCFGTLGKNKNAYNELYNLYLDDPFRCHCANGPRLWFKCY